MITSFRVWNCDDVRLAEMFISIEHAEEFVFTSHIERALDTWREFKKEKLVYIID